IIPHGLVTPVGFVPRMRRFTVVAVTDAGSARAGPTPALANLAAGGRMFGLDGPAGVQLKRAGPLQAGSGGEALRAKRPERPQRGTWEAPHRSLFRALSNVQRMVFILVGLAILSAAFNVLGVLSVLVAAKRSECAGLASLGLTPRGVWM